MFVLKFLFCHYYFRPLNTFIRKGKDPEPDPHPDPLVTANKSWIWNISTGTKSGCWIFHKIGLVPSWVCYLALSASLATTKPVGRIPSSSMCSASISWVVFDPGAAHISNTCARANRFLKVTEDRISVLRIRDVCPVSRFFVHPRSNNNKKKKWIKKFVVYPF